MLLYRCDNCDRDYEKLEGLELKYQFWTRLQLCRDCAQAIVQAIRNTPLLSEAVLTKLTTPDVIEEVDL